MVKAPPPQSRKASEKTEYRSLFEDWTTKSSKTPAGGEQKPNLITPYSYTDYKSLWHTYGTTVADFGYTFDKRKGKHSSS